MRAIMEKTKKVGKNHNMVPGLILAIIIIVAPIVFFSVTFQNHISLEAGEEFKKEMLWKTDIVPLTSVEEVNTDTVGTQSYEAIIFGNLPVRFELQTKDTTPPEVKVSDFVLEYGASCKPEDFIKECKDVSEVSYAFVQAPDSNQIGTQTVIISITDAYDNVTTVGTQIQVSGVKQEQMMNLGGVFPSPQDFVLDPSITAEYVSELNPEDFAELGRYEVPILVNGKEELVYIVVVDMEAPKIHTSSMKVTVKGSISYKKNISVSDNCDDASDITLDIDNSGVDLSTVGSYTILVTATDTAGNASQKEITVQVVAESTEVHTLEEINRLCDALLSQITNDSMTMREKAEAIYKWTYYSIGYADNSPKDDWLSAAYNGLVKQTGDCYTYAATAKALLERLGLEPLVIRKEVTANTSSNNHWWLLLDLGDGYYHYDPTRRKDRTEFFMWTDEELKAYSDAHKGSHNFTRDLYPEIQ